VIVKNGSYEALHEFGRHFGLERLPGTLLPQLDFCALAQAQGVQALRVARPEELDSALKSAFQAAKPILVEVAVETEAASTLTAMTGERT
jgi:benzoylformate decarboxylase